MVRADVLYIGYPRAASTFLSNYFRAHPQINHDDQMIADILYHPNLQPEMVDKPDDKVYISSDESIAESVCITGRTDVWGKHLYNPGAFNLVRYDLIIDPKEAARRMKKWHPKAKILMVIREQVDWFSSLYKYTLSQLPPGQRTFHDYWITPQAIAMRLAAHHDIVIKAWRAQFDDVLVLRCENLMQPGTLDHLAKWLGVEPIPFVIKRANESNATLSKLHRRLPFLSAMPLGIKSALRPLAMMLPNKRGSLLSAKEEQMIREIYRASNMRTAPLLAW